MKMALAVLTYDRPHYLSLVLPSILGQRVEGDPISSHFDIHVFQDGLCQQDPRSDAAGHQRVSEIVGQLPDHVEKYRQSDNLGVALHFDFVEKLLFREKQYDFVVFCEDDLVLAPQYAEIMVRLAKKFRDDPRVGMLSAHPARPDAPKSEQIEKIRDYTSMDHNWAFGLFRTFWEKRQSFVELYLNFLGDVPYRQRPEKKIFEWLRKAGFKPNASSQDYIKTCATSALGAAKISTFANFALPIGRTGLHSRPEIFDRFGFANTVVCDVPFEAPGALQHERFQQIMDAQKRVTMENSARFPSPSRWLQQVRSGALDPQKLLGGSAKDFLEEVAPERAWSAADIPRVPHMEAEGVKLLKERLADCSCFLEYGAGGSTVLAAEMGVPAIYSVESDRVFLDAVKAAVEERTDGTKLVDHYVDIGPTAEWGNPRDSSQAAKWPLYPSSIWNDIIAREGEEPELVLIDGRFRVACFLATLMFAKPETTILFDDYYDRPHYHTVEKYIAPVSRAGRMAEFRTTGTPPRAALIDLMAHSTNFG